MKRRIFIAFALASLVWLPGSAVAQTDPLSSWNDGKVEQSVVEFVTRVITHGGKDFVPERERIAVFDNDGTLWAEQPIYFQLAFALDRVKALAPQHREWKSKDPFASLLKGDVKGALSGGEPAIVQIVMATCSSCRTRRCATSRRSRPRRPRATSTPSSSDSTDSWPTWACRAEGSPTSPHSAPDDR